jgi:hypothetical protein
VYVSFVRPLLQMQRGRATGWLNDPAIIGR